MDVNELEPAARRPRIIYVVPLVLLVPVVAIIVVLAVASSASATITTATGSLATIHLPFGAGTVDRVTAVGGKEQKAINVSLHGDAVLPDGQLRQGTRITVIATVKRPGWVSWLSGSTEKIRLTKTTPRTRLASSFITRKKGKPLQIAFTQPVSVLGTHAAGSDPRDEVLTKPTSALTLNESAVAGTVLVSVAPRAWERPTLHTVSWFPAGSKSSAVAVPSPGTKITPSTPIRLTFSKTVAKALDGKLPPVSPAGSGAWERINSHTIEFVPSGYGYGLGAEVTIPLPNGVNLVGGTVNGSDPVGKWTVPDGSTLALQQLLAGLGYLPVTFKPASGATSLADETPEQIETSAVHPPKGTFAWRYPNTPAALKKLWSPTNFTELTKGAIMAFEYNTGLTVDGVASQPVWKALIEAAVKDHKYTFGYTFVSVSENLPENVHVWHDGKIVVSGPVNTGIAAAPTQTGTFAVYEHLTVTTMSGLNPNGTKYDDPGIPWVSYFNGGDALHGFIRASYGFPQSLGCVEMPYAQAGKVWPYTPIGTIVQVNP